MIDNKENIKFEDYEIQDQSQGERVRESALQKATRDSFENAHSYIKRGVSAVSKDKQITLQHNNAKEYAKKNGLWIESLYDLGNDTDIGGLKNRIALNLEK